MITIEPFNPPGGESASYRLGFTVKGHAGYAEHGADIVCSAVSGITQTALFGLKHYNPVSYTMKDGLLKVSVESDDHTSDAIIKTMLLGLEVLQAQYPECIQIKETGETM